MSSRNVRYGKHVTLYLQETQIKTSAENLTLALHEVLQWIQQSFLRRMVRGTQDLRFYLLNSFGARKVKSVALSCVRVGDHQRKAL